MQPAIIALLVVLAMLVIYAVYYFVFRGDDEEDCTWTQGYDSDKKKCIDLAKCTSATYTQCKDACVTDGKWQRYADCGSTAHGGTAITSTAESAAACAKACENNEKCTTWEFGQVDGKNKCYNWSEAPSDWKASTGTRLAYRVPTATA